MLKPMPDTSKEPIYGGLVKKGQMGFYALGGVTTKVGEYADIIFPLIDSPFKEYIYKNYEKKKNALNKDERNKYKKMLNIPSGLIARKNVFMRNAIIYYSNEYIKSFIDENTVYVNIDSIVSLTPRYDIPIGNDIGQFKCEHQCDNFKYIQNGQYQWNKECHYSGIPGSCLTDIEDAANWKENIKYKIEGEYIYGKE